MSEQLDRFWLVWNFNGGEPRQRHASFEDADREAQRMAQSHPGNTFVVLTAAKAYKSMRPVEEIELTEPDMPF